MDQDEYRNYLASGEPEAEQFVREHVQQAVRYWVDISEHIEYDQRSIPNDISDETKVYYHAVLAEMYPKKTNPLYPKRSDFTSEEAFKSACDYERWLAAKNDIESARERNYFAHRFLVEGYFVPDKAAGYDENGQPAKYKYRVSKKRTKWAWLPSRLKNTSWK